jgi:hypothetical protein
VLKPHLQRLLGVVLAAEKPQLFRLLGADEVAQQRGAEATPDRAADSGPRQTAATLETYPLKDTGSISLIFASVVND